MPLSLTAGPRTISHGKQFDRFFPVRPAFSDQTVMRDGSTEDAVKTMAIIAEQYKGDTALLASYLQGKTLEETARNIWNFIYSYNSTRIHGPKKEVAKAHTHALWD